MATDSIGVILKAGASALRESYTSKKFWSFIFTIASMVVFALLASKVPALVPMFDTFVGGAIAALGIYQTGNVMNKHVISKNLAAATPPPEPDAPEEPPKA